MTKKRTTKSKDRGPKCVVIRPAPGVVDFLDALQDAAARVNMPLSTYARCVLIHGMRDAGILVSDDEW
jgi:hypothetical protein